MTRERLAVAIEPLDPLLFGDNRSARAGEDHLQLDQEPTPPTLFGAIGGRVLAALGSPRGGNGWRDSLPLLGTRLDGLDNGSDGAAALAGYCYATTEGSLRFAKALHLVVQRAGEHLVPGGLLRPEPLAAGATSLPLPRRLTADPEVVEDEETEPLFVDQGMLEEVLTGGPVEGERLEEPEALFLPDRRLGIGMSNRDNTTVPGRLFSRPYRRFRTGEGPAGGLASCGFAAWLDVLPLGERQPEALDGIGFVGGDRRRARFRFSRCEGLPLEGLLDAVVDAVAESEGLVLYLLTPAVVPAEGFGYPLFQRTGSPVAAAIGRPRTMSGWRSVGKPRGPRPIRTLHPEGSVFFFDWPDDRKSEDDRKALVRSLWLQALDPVYANFGFGRVLAGVWR